MKRRSVWILLLLVSGFASNARDKSHYNEAFADIKSRQSWRCGEELYGRAVDEYPDELAN